MKDPVTNEMYTTFIKAALSVGFTDDQADFLWVATTPLK